MCRLHHALIRHYSSNVKIHLFVFYTLCTCVGSNAGGNEPHVDGSIGLHLVVKHHELVLVGVSVELGGDSSLKPKNNQSEHIHDM